MQPLIQTSTNTREIIKLFSVVLGTILLTSSQGVNAIIFPITMENFGFSKSLIGLITASEVVAGIFIGFNLPRLIHQLGIFRCFILALVLRVCSILLLTSTTNSYLWLLLITLHGLGAFAFLMLLQMLISSVPFKKHRAFKIALFGTSISVGYAIGPIIFSTLSWPTSDTSHFHIGFYVSAAISAIAILPLLLWGIKEKIASRTSAQRPAILKLLKESPDIMGAIIVVGIAILGFSQFIALYGIQSGWQVEQSAFLLTAYMLGALFLEAPLAWLSDYIGRLTMLLLTALTSLLLVVLLPFTIKLYWLAQLDLFILGGLVGTLYSVALTSLSERYQGQSLVEASAGFSLLDNLGGVIGLLLLGVAMDTSSYGFPMVLAVSLAFYVATLVKTKNKGIT